MAGEITEYWNGKDEDNMIDVLNTPDYLLILTYMTLPETSVITVGNAKDDYRPYKAGLKSARPAKEERAMTNNRKISPHFFKSRITDRAFKIALSFPEPGGAGAVPAVKDKLLVRITAPDEERDVTLDQQYEIILFVDNVFYAEEERGHLPFNFPVELTSLPAGEHVITVNVITFGDQIGIGSRKINVVKCSGQGTTASGNSLPTSYTSRQHGKTCLKYFWHRVRLASAGRHKYGGCVPRSR